MNEINLRILGDFYGSCSQDFGDKVNRDVDETSPLCGLVDSTGEEGLEESASDEPSEEMNASHSSWSFTEDDLDDEQVPSDDGLLPIKAEVDTEAPHGLKLDQVSQSGSINEPTELDLCLQKYEQGPSHNNKKPDSFINRQCMVKATAPVAGEYAYYKRLPSTHKMML